MKKRIITGIILALFVTPFLILGGYFMAAFIIILMGCGVYEFLSILKKSNKPSIPIYIYVLSFFASFLMVFGIKDSFDYQSGKLIEFSLNIIWPSIFLILLLLAVVFDKKFTVMNAFYTFSTIMYLSLGLKALLFLRTSFAGNFEGLYMILFVLLITCFSDIFAYFTGMLCYKVLGSDKVHKLNERISPKKTIEGSIGGSLFSCLFGTIFAFFAFKNSSMFHYPVYIYLIISLTISIFGQLGDLALSAIKRYFNVKDYSNILPGHGGVLDRIDSLLISAMVAAFFINILSYIA